MFNKNVVMQTAGVKKYNPNLNATPEVSAARYLRNKAVTESYNQSQKRLDAIEESHRIKEIQESVVNESVKKISETYITNKLIKSFENAIFKEFMFEMFNGSLILDNDFKIAKESTFRTLISEQIDKRGGIEFLSECAKSSKLPYLAKLLEACKKTARDMTKRKMKTAKENEIELSSITFEMDDEDKEEFNYQKDDLSIDELSEKVKNKVYTVIKDEKKRQQKEEDIVNELKDSLKDGDDSDAGVSDNDKNLTESFRRLGITSLEESTLFNSIFRHSVLTYIKESAAHGNHHHHHSDDDDDLESDITIDPDDDTVYDDFPHSEIDMDLILAESIAKYTLMEMFYTIKLENYTHNDIKKFSQKMLNA